MTEPSRPPRHCHALYEVTDERSSHAILLSVGVSDETAATRNRTIGINMVEVSVIRRNQIGTNLDIVGGDPDIVVRNAPIFRPQCRAYSRVAVSGYRLHCHEGRIWVVEKRTEAGNVPLEVPTAPEVLHQLADHHSGDQDLLGPPDVNAATVNMSRHEQRVRRWSPEEPSFPGCLVQWSQNPTGQHASHPASAWVQVTIRRSRAKLSSVFTVTLALYDRDMLPSGAA